MCAVCTVGKGRLLLWDCRENCVWDVGTVVNSVCVCCREQWLCAVGTVGNRVCVL